LVRQRGKAFEQKTIAVFNDILERLSKRVVLVVENLQDLTEELSDDQAWSIRKSLQNQPKLMLVATATSHFSELGSANHAFFELFDTQEVKPLSRTEAATLWNFLSEESRSVTEVRPLQILTGGSPRLLTMMAQFAQQLSMRELMEELSGLIDERTDYFKSQIESLPTKERRVFVAIADLLEFSTAKEIARSARMEVAKVSALLNRLEKRGALDVDAEEPRRKRYAVAERLTCFYFKLRRHRNEAHVAWHIVKFARDFYTQERLYTVEGQYIQQYIVDPAIECITIDKQDVLSELRIYASGIAGGFKYDDPEFAVNRLQHHIREYLSDRTAMPVTTECKTLSSTDNAHISAYFNEARTLEQRGNFSGAIAVYDRLIEKYGEAHEPIYSESIVGALFNRTLTVGKLGDHKGEVAGYDELIRQYETVPDPRIQDLVSKAILNCAYRVAEYGDLNEAIVKYDQLIEKFRGSQNLEIKEKVANALLSRALTLREIGDESEAITGFEEVMHNYGTETELGFKSIVAKAMFSRASMMGEKGDLDEEIGGYDELIELFGGAGPLQLRECTVNAMFARAFALGEQEKFEKSMVGYNQLVQEYGDEKELKLLTQVARAIVNRGSIVGAQGEHENAIVEYDRAIELFSEYIDSSAMAEMLMAAVQNRAVSLSALEDYDEAIVGYDQLIGRLTAVKNPQLVGSIASAMFARASIMIRQEDYEGAIVSYDKLIEAHGESDDNQFMELVARVMFNRAIILFVQGELRESIAGYDKLIEKYKGVMNTVIRGNYIDSVVNRALSMAIIGENDCSDEIELLPGESVVSQIILMVNGLARWAEKGTEREQAAVSLLATKVIALPNHGTARVELGLGLAALMEFTEALDVFTQSGCIDELQPLASYLKRQSDSGRREVFELSEMADDVAVKIEELRRELYS